MTEVLGFARFAELEGAAFQLRSGEGPRVDLVLLEARELGHDPAFEQFSLLFRGPREPFLSQGTYLFSHDDLGELAIFLTAISQSTEGFTYQAVFNRFREPRP